MKVINLTLDGEHKVDSSVKTLEKILDHNTKLQDQDMMGWVQLPQQSQALKASRAWSKSLKKSQNHLCVLGIGGSALGTQAVYDFIQPKKRVSFLSSSDGYEFEKRIHSFELRKMHFIAISKSGETSETLIQLSYVLQLLKKSKINPSEAVTVVTENKNSTLKNIATKYNLKFLDVPFDVGGRFSVFTNVGLAPLVWSGVDVAQVLKGAAGVAAQKEDVARLAEFYLQSLRQEYWISVFWIYCEGLKTFGLWLEQLWSESLAKKVKWDGTPAPRVSTPLICAGPNDQHSLLQQFVQGAKDKSFIFIRNKQSEASKRIVNLKDEGLKVFAGRSVGELLGLQAQATRLCLQKLNLPTAEMFVPDHGPRSIGALIYFFELLVACLASRLEINAYNQPGVEDVKKIVLGTLGDLRYSDQALKSSL